MLATNVSPASVSGRDGAMVLLSKASDTFPRRWAVERTSAWQGKHPRLSKDHHEYRLSTLENVIYLAKFMILLRRLTGRPPCPFQTPSGAPVQAEAADAGRQTLVLRDSCRRDDPWKVGNFLCSHVANDTLHP
ncbi:hypothetical protein GCM10010182_07230 [Actinomadura cremea]|nr:hypothetical protein GCM10010182_07230 [Actinomadura cremea]